MSGGAFDYKQHHLTDIADEIDAIVSRNGIEDEWGCASHYSEKTLTRFRETAKQLRVLSQRVHRIDWLVSGDDGEETFHRLWDEMELENQ